MPNGQWAFQPVEGDPFAPQKTDDAPSWKFQPVEGDPFTAPAPGANGNNRTAWKHLPMAQEDDETAPAPPAADQASDAPRSGIGWRAKVADAQAGQTPQGQSQAIADLNAPLQGLIEGVGQTVRGAGEKVEAFRRQDAEQRLDIVNRTLSGQGMPLPPIGSTGNEPEFAMQSAYADMTPDQLREAKAGLEARLKDAAPGQDTGKAVIDFAQKQFPIDKKNEGFQTEALSAAGSSIPALAAGTAAGLAAGPVGALAATGAAMFPQSYDSTYQDAIAKGATPDQADAAATKSAAVQSAVQSVPFSRAVQMVPAPLRDGFVKTAMHLAGQGVEFSAANAASTLAENYVAQQTYDPSRALMQGVAHSAEVGAVTGPIVGTAMSGAHAVVQHAVDVATPIASPAYAAGQAKLRELGGLPPLPDQSQAAAPAQSGAPTRPELANPEQSQPPAPQPAVQGNAAALEPAAEAALRPPASTADDPVATAPPVAATPATTPDPTKPSAANPYVMVRPSDLTLDPKRFQYKEADPDTGVTGALTGVKRWEPALADPIDAYRDSDGKLYVVNGHQRTDLATRAEAAGQPDVQIPARVYDAADGYTPDYMRALGAYRNIAQGSGTAIDAAKVMRATPPDGFTLPELPPRSSMVQQGQGLAKLSDEAFGAVVNNVVPAPYAAEVGRAIADPAQQMAAIGVLRQADPANVEQARILVQDVRDSGFLAGSQDDMFGSQAFAQSLFPQRARVLAQALQNLRGNKRVFKAAVEGEDALSAAGNQMDTAANQQGQTENERLIDTLQRSATTRGPLSDALSVAARDVASGKQVRGASADFLAQARSLVRRGQAESVQSGADPQRAGPAGAGSEDSSSGPAADDVGPPQEGPGLFSARAGTPPEAPGTVRFFHGSKGSDPTSGGSRWVTADPAFARDFRAGDQPNDVHYVDLPQDHPLVATHELEGTPGYYAHFEVPQEVASGFKPYAFRDAQGQRSAAADPQRMQALAESIMRYTGTGKDVSLKLVQSIEGGRADGSYANKLITFALDTKPSDVPGKLFHEIVHAMRDPELGLLKPGERGALDQAAFKYLKQGTNRADIVARYGDDASVVHEEAIARLAEEAHARAGSQPPFITRLADRMRNFVVGLGQALRGRGFTTADDVFRSMMRGDRSAPAENAALTDAVADRAPTADSARPADAAQGAADRKAGESIAEVARQVQANTPETYFARRDPKMTDKEGLERAGQASMFGRNDAAVQAQAARDAAGGLRGKGEQKAADEGLFAPREPGQGALFSLRDPIPPEPAPPASKKENQENASRAIERVLATGQDAYHAAYRKDLGWVSFLHGDATAGIQHIITRRGEEQKDGKAMVRALPSILTYGHAGPFYMDQRGMLKRNVVWSGKTAVLQMTHDGERLTWVLTGFDAMKPVPKEGTAISQPDARKMIADALIPGFKVRDLATQQGHQPDLRAPAPRPQPTSERTASSPRESVISAPAGSGDRNVLAGSGDGKADPQDVQRSVDALKQQMAGREAGTDQPKVGQETAAEALAPTTNDKPDTPADTERFSLRDGRDVAERERDATNLALAFQQPRTRLPMVRAIADDALRILSPTSLKGAKPAEFVIRRNAADQARSYARTVANLSDMRDAVNALPVDQQLAFTARMEAGQRQATPELQSVADMLRKSYDGWAGKIQSLGKGLLEHTIENYLPHVWSNYAEWKAGLPPDPAADPMARAAAGAGSKAPIRGSGAFLKQRSFETQEAGMKAGLVPISTNPVDIAMIKLREMQKMYHGTRMAEEMKQVGIAQWVPVAGESTAAARSAGWVKLDDSVFQPTSMQDGGQMTHGAWWAPEAPARIFNNYVSRGLSGKPIYDAIRASGNALNGLQLGLSGFHATFVTMDTAISKVALGLRQVSRGDIGKGLGNMAMALPPAIPVAAALTARRGTALRQAILYPEAATPELKRIADLAMTAGARIGQQQIFRTEAAGSFVRNMGDFVNGHMAREVMATFRNAPGPGPVKLITGAFHAAGRVIETTMQPLMEVYVPRAKLGVFADMARDWTEANPDATPEETADAMTKAWDSVDNRLGQLVYDNLFWSKSAKDLAFVATRSVGWNVGTIRELGGAAVDTVAQVGQMAQRRPPELTHRMAYAVAMPMVTAMIGAMATYLRTGQGPQNLLDYFYPPDGKGGRTAIPGYIKDVIDYSKAPIQTLANKTHPLFSVAQQVHTNRDYYGGIIYDAQHDNPVQAYLEYVLNQTLPFSIRSIKKENAEGMSSLDKVAAFWGFQPAPAAIVNPGREDAWQAKDDAKAYRKREREKGRISFN